MSSIRALFVVATAVSLAACAATGHEEEAAIAPLPTAQFPLSTVAAPQGLLLAPHDFGISRNQAAALDDLAGRWRQRAEGLVVIESPAGGGPDSTATAYAARDALVDFGVPRDAIEIRGYEGDGTARAPIRVSHLGVQAKIDDCSRAWPDLTKTAQNMPAPNFGCTVNANIAAMIADPADIDRPRGIDPADAGRRQVVLEKYRQGKVTSSETDDQATAAVSQAVN